MVMNRVLRLGEVWHDTMARHTLVYGCSARAMVCVDALMWQPRWGYGALQSRAMVVLSDSGEAQCDGIGESVGEALWLHEGNYVAKGRCGSRASDGLKRGREIGVTTTFE